AFFTSHTTTDIGSTKRRPVRFAVSRYLPDLRCPVRRSWIHTAARSFFSSNSGAISWAAGEVAALLLRRACAIGLHHALDQVVYRDGGVVPRDLEERGVPRGRGKLHPPPIHP